MSLNTQIKKFKEDEMLTLFFKKETIGNFINCNEVGISKIIAWLLDAEETHGLGNEFAKAFIRQLNKKKKLGLSVNALNNAVILTEFSIRHNNQDRRLDILITTDELCIVIENKFGSKEHSNQLKAYKNYFEDKRKKIKIITYYVYLDINYEERGEENKINSDWIALNYNWILDFLNENIKSVKNSVSKSILTEFCSKIKAYDIYDNIDELCLKHHELINEITKISQEKITNYIFGKCTTFNVELYKIYVKHQWIFDELISHNKFFNNIKLINDIFNVKKYKDIRYNIKKCIELTHKDTYKYAEEHEIYWGGLY